MKKGTLLAISIFLLSIIYGFVLSFNNKPERVGGITVPTPPPVVDENVVFRLVNEYRVEHGLNSVKLNETMCELMEDRPHQLSVTYNHDAFKGTTNKLNETGESFYASKENANKSVSASPSFIVESWKNSPTHNGAILEKEWTDSCVQCDRVEGTDYCVQWFAY